MKFSALALSAALCLGAVTPVMAQDDEENSAVYITNSEKEALENGSEIESGYGYKVILALKRYYYYKIEVPENGTLTWQFRGSPSYDVTFYNPNFVKVDSIEGDRGSIGLSMVSSIC